MPRRNQGPRLRWLEKRGCYYIVWSKDGRSRERSTATTDREGAEIALAEFLHERQRKLGPRDPAEVLITDVLTDYAVERGAVVLAPDRIGYAIAPLAEYFEGKILSDITPETCLDYARWRERAAGTVRRELGVLRASLNHAHKEGRVTRVVYVSLPERPEPKERWLYRHEAAALLRSALKEPKVRLYLPLFILIGLKTGARKQAILSLRWSQVDLVNARIDFNDIGHRRSKKRRARIPIPSKLLPHLKRARRRGTENGFVINRDGERLGDIKKGFAAACERTGLSDVSPHTLRHTCATWLMRAGVDKFDACGYLCMTLETLERTYAHHHPDYLKSAAEAL